MPSLCLSLPYLNGRNRYCLILTIHIKIWEFSGLRCDLLKSWVQYLLAMWPWKSFLTSLYLSFLMSAQLVGLSWDHNINKGKMLRQCLADDKHSVNVSQAWS